MTTTLRKAARMMAVVTLLTTQAAASERQEPQIDAQRARGELTGQVAARDTDVWRMWLPAGRHRVVVIGNGNTDLDLYVDAAPGRRLAVDDGETDRCVGEFHLRRAGYVEIRIRNLGRVYNEYRMFVR
jgi:hypothetical protein